MMFWRIWAALLGSSLMIGETIRSWGQGRNLLFVLDDFCIGVPLVVVAVLMANPTPARWCAFSALIGLVVSIRLAGTARSARLNATVGR